MDDPNAALHFPYMVFARDSGGGAPFPLIFSGMPPPDPAVFGAEPPDLGFAGAEALPRLQDALGTHLGVPPERVLVTVGASAAMLHLALTYYRGARVAVELPSYQPLRALPGLHGGVLAPFERRAEDRYALDPDRVRHALETARRAASGTGGPGHVVVTSPHNPSGRLVPPAELAALAAVAAEQGGLLIANEIYLEYVPRAERTSAVHLAPNTVSIGSVTKAYGLGALRLGWIALGEGPAADRARLEDAAFLNYVDPPTPILRLGLRALEHLGELIAPYERLLVESKPLFARWLRDTPGVEGAPPDHGLIAFPRLVGVEDTHAFQRRAVRDHGVDVVPGEYFGRPGHVRLGFGVEPDFLTEALARLTRALADR